MVEKRFHLVARIARIARIACFATQAKQAKQCKQGATHSESLHKVEQSGAKWSKLPQSGASKPDKRSKPLFRNAAKNSAI